MNWKEILKVSLLYGFVSFILQLIVSFFVGKINVFYIEASFVGILATCFVLNRRLKNDDNAILVGAVIAFLLPLLLAVILSTVFDYSILVPEF